MKWIDVRDVFVRFKAKTDADKAAQLIMSRIKDQDELRRTYRAAPDLFDHMDHPRLNMLMFNLL